jgi:hypothetical protein
MEVECGCPEVCSQSYDKCEARKAGRMSNVKYYCEKCNHIVFAPPDTEPPCRENLGDECEMEQVEQFPPKQPKKVTSTPTTSTKKATSDKPNK